MSDMLQLVGPGTLISSRQAEAYRTLRLTYPRFSVEARCSYISRRGVAIMKYLSLGLVFYSLFRCAIFPKNSNVENQQPDRVQFLFDLR